MWFFNRYRGTHVRAAWFVGLAYGFIIYLIFGNPYVGVLCTAGYIAGESMGWGEWIGGIIRPDRPPDGADIEGCNNGIHWLAAKIADRGTLRYNYIALTLRGIWWWLPALSPLAWHVGISPVLISIVALAIAFPFSVMLAKESDFHIDYLDVNAPWGRAEVIYGAVMDVVLLLLIFTGLTL